MSEASCFSSALYYIVHRPTTTMLWLHYAPSTTLSHREIVVTVGILVIFLPFVIDRLLSVLHLVKVWRKLTESFKNDLCLGLHGVRYSSICEMQEECTPAPPSNECGQHCTKAVAKWISFLRSQQNTLLNDCTTKMSLGLFDRTWWRVLSYHIAYRGG